MNKLIFIFVITLNMVFSAPSVDNLVISLPDGKIQGALYTTPNNITYYGYRGIPYATPPLGNLRFEVPQPPKPWSDILDATSDSKRCISIQYFNAPEAESEDCLFINVYTPSLQADKKLPVMFWIYGGGFLTGNASKQFYGPDFLIEEDIVVVSSNYRLGPFGFLSTGDSVIPGNAGLKDQSLALKWTYDNIEYFGGDPEKITIFGQSSGAVSVGLHLLNKKSAGLFRAAILESSSALTPFAINLEPRSYAFSLADTISGGSYGNSTQELKSFLLERTVDEIIKGVNSRPQFIWPNIEVENADSFLTESPYELLENGRFNQVSIIIGICAEESIMFLKDIKTTRLASLLFDAVPSSLIPSDLRANSSVQDAAIDEIKNIYLEGRYLFSTNLLSAVKYISDNFFTRGIIRHAELQSMYTPVYLYQFAYYGRPVTPAFLEGAEKAGHAAELPFLFNIPHYRDNSSESLLTQRRIVKLWTNFAKFLNPTPENSELFNNITWPTTSRTNQQFLNINGTLEVRSNIRGKSYPQWNEIYETYGQKPFITY